MSRVWNTRVTPLYFAVVVAVILTTPGVANARSQRNLVFRPDLVWTAAVRLLRVDLGCELVERDADARFVIFRYVDGQHAYPGSLEIAEHPFDDGRTGVRVTVSVPDLPSYVELNLIDRLERKLIDEIGAPPPLPRPAQQRASSSTQSQDRERSTSHDEDPDESDEGDDDDGEVDEGRGARRRSDDEE